MALRPVSVSQLNEYISRVLQTDPLLGNISVKGEISNLKYHSTGHVYFSMKDEQSKINCFLPASYAERLKIDLVDGMEIIVSGYINVYKRVEHTHCSLEILKFQEKEIWRLLSQG